MNIKILVFASSKERIPSEVLDSIRIQGIEPELVDCTFDDNILKRKRIAMAKEKCRQIGLVSGFKYVVLNDSDLMHTRTDNFKVMEEFLDEKKEFGAVSLLKQGMKDNLIYDDSIIGHVCSGVIMFSREGLDKVKFNIFEESPTCFSVGRSLASSGKKYGYVDNVYRVESLRRKDNGNNILL